MLTGAAALDAYLGCRPAPPGDERSDYAIAASTADPIRPPSVTKHPTGEWVTQNLPG